MYRHSQKPASAVTAVILAICALPAMGFAAAVGVGVLVYGFARWLLSHDR